MKSGHLAIALAAVLIVALIIVGSIAYVALTRPAPSSSSSSSQPGSANYNQQVASGNGKNCSVSVTQTITGVNEWLNNSKTPPIFLAATGETINLYINGVSSTALKTTTSSAGAFSLTGVNCNTFYNVTGSDTTPHYLTNMSVVYTGTSANPSVIIDQLNYSAPTLLATNGSSSATPVSTPVRYHSAVAGQAVSWTAYVKAGTNYDGQNINSVSSGSGSLGSGGALLVLYNSSVENPPQVSGLNSASGYLTGFTPSYTTANTGAPGATIAFVNGENAYVAFLMPAGVNGQYSTTTGVLTTQQGSGGIPIQAQLKGAYSANVVNGFAWMVGEGYWNPSLKGYQPLALINTADTAVGPVIYDGNAIFITPN